jgi:hypothetical protein
VIGGLPVFLKRLQTRVCPAAFVVFLFFPRVTVLEGTG